MTPEKAIECIDDVLYSDVNYDESIDYELTSDDIGWLEKAREALVQNTEYDKISRSVKEFWSELEKLSVAKGKDVPTLEELLEYIENEKQKAVCSLFEEAEGMSEVVFGDVAVRLSDLRILKNEMEGDM